MTKVDSKLVANRHYVNTFPRRKTHFTLKMDAARS